MYLLSKEGSRHLLEFLRNLTPQVLLLSTALVLFYLWNSSRETYLYLALASGVSLMFVLAALANANNFLDNAISGTSAIAAERDRLKIQAVNGIRRIRAIVSYIWKEHPGTLIELAVAMIFVYGSLVAILVASVAGATRALR